MKAKKPSLKDLKDFRGWLQKSIENGATSYNAHSSSNCLVCQYLRDRGAEVIQFSGETTLFRYEHADGPAQKIELPMVIAKIAYGMNGKLEDYTGHTFQEALERADKVIKKLQA